jgi:hypothetical protein
MRPVVTVSETKLGYLAEVWLVAGTWSTGIVVRDFMAHTGKRAEDEAMAWALLYVQKRGEA